MKLEIRPSNIGTSIRLIAAMFMIIDGRVHWTLKLTSSYLKTSVFDRPHEYDKSPFLKIYSLESVFENLRICCRIRRFRVDGSRIRRKKSPFLKISGYVWTGP